MMKILLICGGKSHEHEISLKSAEFVVKYANQTVNILVVGKDNHCVIKNNNNEIIAECNFGSVQIHRKNESEFTCNVGNYYYSFNVVFPMLHGCYGEDGTMQGWLELLGVPYVGCGVLAAAISMDKDIAKGLVKLSGINTPNYITLDKHSYHSQNLELDKLNYPVFVKPANSGSSIGISKVKEKADLLPAITTAFTYDSKVLIETALEKPREIEVAVLENEKKELILGQPGELVVKHEFYSYEAKYLDKNGAELLVPAPLSNADLIMIKNCASKIFRALGCAGMARVDFLLVGKKLFFNEVNVIPGFTEISLYPIMMKAAGIDYPQLIDILLAHALSK